MNAKRINVLFFLVIYLAVFSSIFLKILYVPITHDEVSTIFTAIDDTIWNILSYDNPSPNNHILNTLLTKISIQIFGLSTFSARLPNLLSFFIYSIAVFSLLKNSIGIKSWFFVSASLFFVSNLYFLDFFGLSRGYAMSSAFCLLSLSYFLPAIYELNFKKINRAVFFAMVAVYVNFTTIYFLSAILVLTVLLYVHTYRKNIFSKKRFLSLLLIVVLFMLLIFQPIIRMENTNQFQFWSNGGFIHVTLNPLIQHSMYGTKVLFFQFSIFFKVLFYLVVIYSFLYISYWIYQKKTLNFFFSNPLIISFIIFGLVIFINRSHVYLTGIPNLANRTALFYYPLFVLVLVFSLHSLRGNVNRTIKVITSSIFAVLCVLQIITTFKISSVREWSYDSNTLDVIENVFHFSNGKSVSLSTDWKFNPSFHFYSRVNQLGKITLTPYSKTLDTNNGSDFYYIFEDDLDVLKENYKVVKSFSNHTVLLQKKGELP